MHQGCKFPNLVGRSANKGLHKKHLATFQAVEEPTNDYRVCKLLLAGEGE